MPIFIGGLIAFFAAKAVTRRAAAVDGVAAERAARRGLLFASGLITGEALVGILLAVPFAYYESANVWAVSPEALGLSVETFETLASVLGIALFAGFCGWLYRVASRSSGGAVGG